MKFEENAKDFSFFLGCTWGQTRCALVGKIFDLKVLIAKRLYLQV